MLIQSRMKRPLDGKSEDHVLTTVRHHDTRASLSLSKNEVAVLAPCDLGIYCYMSEYSNFKGEE